MKFKDVLWKRALGEITIFHTRSAYKVMVDEPTLNILWGMCSKSPKDLTDREKDYYRKLRAQNMMEPGVGVVPEERSQSSLVHLDIEIASVCNLSCKHCFANNHGQMMSLEMFQKIAESSLKLGAIAVSLNGGEPLLNLDIVEIVRRSLQHFRTDLFTNATLITEEFCKQIAPLGLDKIFISLDGFQKQHEAVRGEGTYEKTIHGIKLLRKHGVRVWINSILHQNNEGDLPEFQKFCMQTLGVNGMRFVPVNPLGNAEKNMEMFRYPQKTRDKMIDSPDTGEHPFRRSDILLCRAGLSTIYIAADGGVYPCNYFRRADYCWGNIATTDLSAIYTSQMQRDSIFTKFNEEQLTECKKCALFASCGGGCRGRALVLTGNLYGKDPLSCATRGLVSQYP